MIGFHGVAVALSDLSPAFGLAYASGPAGAENSSAQA
jgi:hypothetical protein